MNRVPPSTGRRPRPTPATVRDLRGGVRLAIDGVQGVIDIVESMHQRIASVSPPVGRAVEQPTGGVTGLVYRTVRGTTGVVGGGLDLALASFQAALQPRGGATAPEQPQPMRDAAVAALNGVVGDHLERSGNPLALEMQLLVRGPARPRLLVLVHGLCLSDASWSQRGHDHGLALAAALGWTPVYLRYNTGRHVSVNGRQLAAELGRLVAGWPLPVEGITLLGHSMGGLVIRSAAHQARQASMAWPALLRQMVFLGTPHHGAPLERGGNWLHAALGVSPYLAPFTRLTGLRSEGITDLRHGNLLDEDWAGGRFLPRDARSAVPLPQGVACHAIAGTLTDGAAGDGLVPVASALGRHAVAGRDLQIPPSRHWIAQGVGHLALLRDEAVHQKMRQWLSGTHP
jgi:pimeloyl-ACP methyl ester carboxylesterase